MNTVMINNLQIRNEVMRRIKFEQIRRSSLPNFIRDTKKYLLDKRKEAINKKNKQNDSDLFSIDNIKIVDSEKEEVKISDLSLKPKQREFIKFVLNNLKKDGQKARTKDLQVKKMLMELFSHDVKHYALDKNANLSTQQLYEMNSQNFIEKYNKSKFLTTKTWDSILRKIVPKIDSNNIISKKAVGA